MAQNLINDSLSAKNDSIFIKSGSANLPFIGKRILLFAISICFSLTLNAQVSKSLNVTAGSLSSALTATELETVTNLILTGTMDARDFKTMRDLMPALAVLDLSGGTIVVYNGTGGTKPFSSSNNYPANVIPDCAFSNQDIHQSKTSLVTVVIPSSATSIGNSAFGSCTGLTTITLPSSLTSIGNDAFSFCSGLTSMTLPSSVKSIGGYAFYSCSRLTSITIPPSVTTIGSSAFYYCMKLTSITIPHSVTSIGANAFEGCSGLTTVMIPSSLSSIGESAFDECSGLTTVTIPSSVTSIGNHAFRSCSGLTSVSIPYSVTSIGDGAFQFCSGLKTITIPTSVFSIGYNAFMRCSGLTEIIAANPIPINFLPFASVFDGINKATCTLYVPVGSKLSYQAANGWKDFTHIVEKDFTGIDPISNEKQLTAYPNPTLGRVKLILDQIPQNGTYLTITDVTGRMILKQLMLNKEELIDLQGNSPGVYFIKTSLKNSKVQKVILK